MQTIRKARFATLKRFIIWAKSLNCTNLIEFVACLENSEFSSFSLSEAVLKMYALQIKNNLTNSKNVRLIIPKY